MFSIKVFRFLSTITLLLTPHSVRPVVWPAENEKLGPTQTQEFERAFEKSVKMNWVDDITKLFGCQDFVSTPLHSGKMPLDIAVLGDRPDIIKLLAKSGANINAVTNQGSYPILEAVRNFKQDSLASLISLGVSCDLRIMPSGFTALHFAALLNNLFAAKQLVEYRCSLDAKDVSNNTPIMIATDRNRTEMVDFLIAKGASLHATIAVAIAKGYWQIAESLLKIKGGYQPIEEVINIFCHSLINTERKILKIILTHNPKLLNHKCGDLSIPLIYATEINSAPLIRVLVNSGADFKAKTTEGITAVEVAILNKAHQALRELISLGAVNSQNDYSPLVRAVYINDIESVLLLIKKVNNINWRNRDGFTALDIARQLKLNDIVDVLVAHGAVQSEPRECPALTPEEEAARRNDFNLFPRHVLTDLSFYLFIASLMVCAKTFSLLIDECKDLSRRKKKVLEDERAKLDKVAEDLAQQEQLRKLALHNTRKALILSQLGALCIEFKNQLVLVKENEGELLKLIANHPITLRPRNVTTENDYANLEYEIPDAIVLDTIRVELKRMYGENHFVETDESRSFAINLQNTDDLIGNKNLEKLTQAVKNSLFAHCHVADECQLERIILAYSRDQALGKFSFYQIHKKTVFVTIKEKFVAAVEKADEVNNSIENILGDLSLATAMQNVRTKKPLDELQRHLRPFVYSSFGSNLEIVTLLNNMNEQQEAIKAHIDGIAKESDKSVALTVLIQMIANLEDIQNDFNTELALLNKQIQDFNFGLDALVPPLKKGVSFYRRDLEKETPQQSSERQRLEQKQLQRERDEVAKKAVRELFLREHAEAKLAFRVEKDRITAERKQREANELIKRQKEEALNKQVAVESSSSNSNVLPQMILLQRKITTLGDLLNRYFNEKENDASKKLTYRYALLAECLRIFEFIKATTNSAHARLIRNALMHRHQFVSVDALSQFSSLIAHLPSEKEKASDEKLEDFVKATNYSRMHSELSRLAKSEFCSGIISKVTITLSPREHIANIYYLIEDLSNIAMKENVNLSYFPDKILAIKGILCCIGECQQQYNASNPQQHFIPMLQTYNANFAPLHSLLTHAGILRQQMGHRLNDIEQSALAFSYFLKHATTMLECLDSHLGLNIQNRQSTSSRLVD